MTGKTKTKHNTHRDDKKSDFDKEVKKILKGRKKKVVRKKPKSKKR